MENLCATLIKELPKIKEKAKIRAVVEKKGEVSNKGYAFSNKNLARCSFIRPDGSKCNIVAIKNQPFCCFHIDKKLLEQLRREKFEPVVQTKSSFIDEQDLSFEIQLLKKLLYEKTKSIKLSKVSQEQLENILLLVDKIRQTIGALKSVQNNSKSIKVINLYIDKVLGKVVFVINKYVDDDGTKRLIVKDLVALSEEIGSAEDIEELLKEDTIIGRKSYKKKMDEVGGWKEGVS